MHQDDNPRFVVTSLEEPSPQMLYEALYCARGQSENVFKALKHDLRSDLTSATTFCDTMRLFLACAAYVLHHALRVNTLAQTALAQAQPATVMLKLFKVAAHVKQYKDRIRLHLPSSCPVKALLHRVTAVLYAVPTPVWNTSKGFECAARVSCCMSHSTWPFLTLRVEPRRPGKELGAPSSGRGLDVARLESGLERPAPYRQGLLSSFFADQARDLASNGLPYGPRQRL